MVSKALSEKNMERIYKLKYAETTRDVIEAIDELLQSVGGAGGTNRPMEHWNTYSLSRWRSSPSTAGKDFLTEEMYEENLEAYLNKVSQDMTATRTPDSEEKRRAFGSGRIA